MPARKFIAHALLPAVLILSAVVSGCTTSGAIQQAHWHYLDGNTTAAVQVLNNSDAVASKDRLLFWLEKGMYLHYDGQYEASTDLLLKAEAFLESTDYLSVSDGAKSLLANDWAGHYRGEYSERLWVHSVLMMNFLQLGQFESAAVEARKSLEVIERYPEILKHDHFSRALIGISFEAANQTNDAYIVNTKLNEVVDQSLFSQFVSRQAETLGFSPADPARPSEQVENHAIIFVSDGRIPEKRAGSLFTGDASRISFPEYRVTSSRPSLYRIAVDGKPCSCFEVNSDLGELVAQSLGSRGASLVARAVFRTAAKEAVAEIADEADEIVGGIARVLLFALEEADTRSWRSLPRHFSLIRVPLHAHASELQVSVGGVDHVVALPKGEKKQPLLFYTLHARLES